MNTKRLSPAKRFAFAALLFTLTVMLCAAAFEVAVRLFVPTSDFIWQWDPQIGMKLIPGKRGRSIKPGVFDVAVEVNPAGFRDREHQLKKVPGSQRVVLLGDSFVEALQVPFEKSITALLEGRLRGKIPNTEVINFAVSGTGTARQYLALRQYGIAYEPDVVLMFFVGNDVSDNSMRLQGLPYVPYPQTTRDGKLVRAINGDPVFTPFADQSSWVAGVTGVLKDYSHSYRFVRGFVQQSPHAHRLLYQLRLVSTPPEAVNAPSGDNFGFYEIYRPQLRPVWSDAWNVTEELMVATRDLARAHGAQFGVVLVPAAWEVYPELWEKVLERIPAMREAALDLDKPSNRLSTFLRSQGIPVWSLLPEFRKHALSSAPLYVRDDAHWTSDGHELAAQLLVQPVAEMLTGVRNKNLTATASGN